MNWSDVASLATAGGTLILAVATFGSVKSANRAARAAERSLLAGLRPVLIPSRDDDLEQQVVFGDGQRLVVPGHMGAIEFANGSVYLSLAIRNAGSGVAVLHGWRARAFEPGTGTERPDLDEFRRQQVDLYIPAGDAGFWLGAVRDAHDVEQAELRRAAGDGTRVLVDLLYGDYEGGQRAIVRFSLRETDSPDKPRSAQVLRYWNVDGTDPRDRE
jgi:hypothetical protein